MASSMRDIVGAVAKNVLPVVADKYITLPFSQVEDEGQDRGTEGHTISPSALMQDSSTQVQFVCIDKSI